MPGTSSGLTSEYVVLWGHLDHIGVGAPVGGDSINNGAMDNASGVAALLEVARMLHDGSDRPRRSILFLACTGEEMGLLGSKPFAGRPTVAIGNIAANLNLDMIPADHPVADRARHIFRLGQLSLARGASPRIARPCDESRSEAFRRTAVSSRETASRYGRCFPLQRSTGSA